MKTKTFKFYGITENMLEGVYKYVESLRYQGLIFKDVISTKDKNCVTMTLRFGVL